MFENLSLKAKILLGSSVTLIFLIALGLLSLSSIKSLQETNGRVDHTHKVIQEAMHIEAAAVDMETGMRGYLLAGKEGFLSPYTNGQKRFSELVTSLKKTVSDNPAQVTLLGDVQTTIEDWQSNVTESAIALRHAIGDAKSMHHMADLVA
ncbi:MAG: CHASE3 domain-containing protein, partial [Pseudomonadales bacterium]|nr:CHASE3 domain-containing protein [Pseudomonadales bacterium]